MAVVSNVKAQEREREAAQAHDAEMASTRKCPFCAEQIKLEAAVWRYCGRDVPPAPTPAEPSSSHGRALVLIPVGLLVVVVAVAVVLTSRIPDYGSPSATPVQQSQPSTEERTAALRSELITNKAALLKLAESYTLPSRAVSLLEPFEALNDPDVTAALTAARASVLRSTIKNERKHQMRYEYLTQLAELLPNDKGVKAQLTAEHDAIAKEDARNARLEKLSAAAFCSEFHRHPHDDAFARAFVTHGGRQEFAERVQAREIYMGMNEFEVRCAWGRPDEVNRTVGIGFDHKQMVYGSRYVYIENDVMTAMQE